MATEKSKLSVDDFLAHQSEFEFLATIEPVENNSDVVKLTPWLSSGGCLCQYALNISKDSIESLHPTGDRHVCCGKVLRVASVQFKEGATVKLNQLFEQIASSAGSSSASGIPSIASSEFVLQQSMGFNALGNSLRRPIGRGVDPECVKGCSVLAGTCALGCSAAGLGGPIALAICRAGCIALGAACAANCYPLFPDEIFARF